MKSVLKLETESLYQFTMKKNGMKRRRTATAVNAKAALGYVVISDGADFWIAEDDMRELSVFRHFRMAFPESMI